MAVISVVAIAVIFMTGAITGIVLLVSLARRREDRSEPELLNDDRQDCGA
jgi:hypothetical protein